ncbi:hypothetical protein [Lysobacter capsici]|uniref:hypothetical protein n=1 Tax=Lysobacter capsici TaxID=435897 RepID=UPI00287BB001|nr:hypothetical protein [Lysobacter capsici]WND79426.1 hypothetical protein RJ610_19295 [Lysobacter capsici]WND84622.1 hypothetical protein RJ609_19310 [Lysobacter capsici]
MTAQIEQHPREGRELSMPMTWRDYLAYVCAWGLMAGCAFALFFPHPYVVFGLTLFASVIVVVAFILTAISRPGAHL